MSVTVFLAVILAALLHAGWNALVKRGTANHLNMAAVVFGHAPFALLALAAMPAPAPGSWPWLLGSVALHCAYQGLLVYAYRAGDFTQVYPIARGSAPLIVAAVSVGAMGVVLSGTELAGIAMIGAGILSLVIVRRADGLRNPQAALLAFLTGCFIASYSLVDGLGARLSGSPVGYMAWLALGNVVTFALFMAWRFPGDMAQLRRGYGKLALIGGGASFVAYAIATWAFTQAPIALVAALRETSIVFALLIGVGILRERLDVTKVLATFLTLCGAALLRLSRG